MVVRVSLDDVDAEADRSSDIYAFLTCVQVTRPVSYLLHVLGRYGSGSPNSMPRTGKATRLANSRARSVVMLDDLTPIHVFAAFVAFHANYVGDLLLCSSWLVLTVGLVVSKLSLIWLGFIVWFSIWHSSWTSL